MRTLSMFLWMTLLTGVIYPLMITVISNLTMPREAKGSLIYQDHTIVGSALIGQKFESERYFWSRPSAVNDDPLPSGGSQLGPTSRALKKAVERRRLHIASTWNLKDPKIIPSELLFASGSGLDPHITPQCAYFQVDRIAKSRNIEHEKIKKLIHSLVEKRGFGFLGSPCVNVLRLNLA